MDQDKPEEVADVVPMPVRPKLVPDPSVEDWREVLAG